MKILETSINWMENWDNHPSFYMTVDKFPSHEETRYRAYPVPGRGKATLYVSDNQEFVQFLLHDPSNEDGYAGRVFNLTMEDGSVVKVTGPWSSNPDSVFRSTNGEIDCVSVYVREEKDKYHCHGFYMSVDLAKKICEENDAYLVDLVGGENLSNMSKGSKFSHVPSLSPDTLVKPRVWKDYKTHEITKSVLKNYGTGEETEWKPE